jgi:phosphinothricin acetyltransferase
LPVSDPDRIVVDAMRAEDWADVALVYRQGLDTGDASFETEVPPFEEWDRDHLALPRLVARAGGWLVGWAALSPASGRCVYGGVAEDSVYVDPAASGRGVGTALLSELVAQAEQAGIWTIQAGIFPENRVSIALHQRCGFRVVGVRERLGQQNGRWRDVVLLERRSQVI